MPDRAAPVLLYVHNNLPSQRDTIVAPITRALQAVWDGPVLVSDIRDVHVWLGPDAGVLVGGERVRPHRVYARVFTTRYGTTLSHGLAALGARVVNDPVAVARAQSKFEGAATLHAAGLPVPQQSLFVGNPDADAVASHARLGWPRVIKADRGLRGNGVWLADDAPAVQALAADPAVVRPWVAQQYRADAAGRDVRIVVADGEVIGAMERRASPGEFRSNLAQGGTAHPVELSAAERDLAVAAAAAIGLTIAGVDLLRTERGPMITEVNPNPELVAVSRIMGAERVYAKVAQAVVHG